MVYKRLITALFLMSLSSLSWANSSECYENLASLFNHQPIMHLDHQLSKPFEVDSLEDLEQLYGMGDLSYIHATLWESKFSSINFRTLELAEAHNVKTPTSFYKVTEIYEMMKKIDRKVSDKIPESVCLTNGFCYGRAMIAHLLGTKMGIPQENMKKVWVLGNLLSDHGARWNYHVALAIKSDDGFWVLDSNHGLKRVRDFYLQFVEDTEKTPLIFITQPARGSLSRSSQYNSQSFFAEKGKPHYNFGYYRNALSLIDEITDF